MSKLGQNWRFDMRPNAQGFDEVRLVTVPRYKTSELSGDEWRISICAEYFRNGELKFRETIAHDMEKACANPAKYPNDVVEREIVTN